MILDEVKAVMPSFVTRVERPDRGGEWVDYLEARERAGERWAQRLGLDGDAEATPPTRPVGARCCTSTATRTTCWPRCCSRPAPRSEEQHPRGGRARSTPTSARELLADLVGERANRRHRPGRGFEALRYRFEIVSDYGAFRDLQRHRMLTVQWQPLTPDLGAGVPEQVELAGCGDDYRRALEISRREYERLADAGLATAAPTRSASATASATSSTSTRARRCS